MIHVHIVGAIRHFDTLFPLLSLYRIKYRFLKFIVYDSFSNCNWSGGRLKIFMPEFNDKVLSKLKKYQQLGIDVGFLFSNNRYETDTIGHEILSLFPTSYYVISNEYLAKKIKSKCPKAVTICSITRISTDKIISYEKAYKYYDNLLKKFDLVVPRCETVFMGNLLESLGSNRFKIMLNDVCKYYCPYWKKHFQIYHKYNKILETVKLAKQTLLKIHECFLKEFNPYSDNQPERNIYGDKYGMNLQTKQIATLLKRGIIHFKISGRELESQTFKNEVETYVNRIIQAIKHAKVYDT